VEYFQAEFDAIQTATSLGRHVVEAAGNGSMNLDDARYSNLFNRNTRDSGAILVGASARAGQYPTCTTNHGTRVDVRALGEEVATTGYGTVKPPGAEGLPGQWYTRGFNGTSSASAIVAGAVASLMGIQKNSLTRGAALHGVHVMGPAELRTLLRDTGTPQISEEMG
jgi:serine protease